MTSNLIIALSNTMFWSLKGRILSCQIPIIIVLTVTGIAAFIYYLYCYWQTTLPEGNVYCKVKPKEQSQVCLDKKKTVCFIVMVMFLYNQQRIEALMVKFSLLIISVCSYWETPSLKPSYTHTNYTNYLWTRH